MKVKVLSDFHLGCNDKADDFKIAEDVMIKYLDDAISTYDKVILAGDIFECWESTSFNAQKQRFSQILTSRPKLSSYILSKIISEDIIYVVGNHDHVIKEKKLIPYFHSNYIINLPLKARPTLKIYIAHGHEADSFNSKISVVGKMIAWSIGWVERVGLRKEADIIKDMEKYIPGRNSSNDLFEEYAFKKAKKEDYTIVVFGHTHESKVSYKEGKWYGNCGCCASKTSIESLDIEIDEDTSIISICKKLS